MQRKKLLMQKNGVANQFSSRKTNPASLRRPPLLERCASFDVELNPSKRDRAYRFFTGMSKKGGDEIGDAKNLFAQCQTQLILAIASRSPFYSKRRKT